MIGVRRSMDVKVSVIIATYNQEKYIAHTLESVVNQETDFKYEVIVGEDCSTDGTAQIVKEYAEKYPELIIPIIREKNLGMSGNMFDLLSRIKGEYVAIIEGDDYWIDNRKLQKQVEFMDAHPDYVACFGTCIIVDENDVRHPEMEAYNAFMKDKGEYTIRDFEKYILPGQTATSMYRTTGFGLLQKKLSDAKVDTTNMIDRGLVLCMFSVGKIYNIGEKIAAYRRVMDLGSGSWSSQNDFYSVENVINYLEGMKNMEIIAKALSLNLNFDERRCFELDKLYKNKDKFSKEEFKIIKSSIKKDFVSVGKYYRICWNHMIKTH